MRRRHLLLIDDEDDIREVAGLSLEMTQGWTITAGGVISLVTTNSPARSLRSISKHFFFASSVSGRPGVPRR